MADKSYLDDKYFIDPFVYNCPYCNRKHVKYTLYESLSFDWSETRKCHVYFVRCDDCSNTSMHLSFSDIEARGTDRFNEGVDIDSCIFYSVPTSFFVIDSRIPRTIRELVTEAEGCIKMNFLTGASACIRKAIYELTVKEKAEGKDYEERIKFLKRKYPDVDGDLFDILCHIKDMTSEKVHEQSWDKWDSGHLTLFIETLRAILQEIYVLPDEKKKRSFRVRDLLQKIKGNSKKEADESASAVE